MDCLFSIFCVQTKWILSSQSFDLMIPRFHCLQFLYFFSKEQKTTMVEIMWLGQACFYIRCNGTSVVLDPYFQQEKVGFCYVELL